MTINPIKINSSSYQKGEIEKKDIRELEVGVALGPSMQLLERARGSFEHLQDLGPTPE